MIETRLPAPEQLLLVKMTEEEVAEMIERHIEFYTETPDGYRSVHLPKKFVRHFMKRDDGALPIATTVAQLPIVLHNGTLLAGPGLHRPSGVVFMIPDELMRVLPRPADCSPDAVAEAMRFLCDAWLVDVAADYAGKCIIIACALTIIERAVLPERPAFFITAGQRGGGKTTTIHMISTAVLGVAACAAAWSKDEEERRKALLSYFSAGLPMLTWDNIARGSTISCPHIERALTNEFYSDRVLGVSEHRLVASATVHTFTGNNITPRGDMASRSLVVRLAVSRPDPENRRFEHPDPLAWTEAHRGEILASLFTILLGNPRRRPGNHPPPETRFKTWWDIVGSAVENAADEHARARQGITPPTFRELFLAGENDEEQTSSLAPSSKCSTANGPTPTSSTPARSPPTPASPKRGRSPLRPSSRWPADCPSRSSHPPSSTGGSRRSPMRPSSSAIKCWFSNTLSRTETAVTAASGSLSCSADCERCGKSGVFMPSVLGGR
jgi:hypothetical protein